MEDLFRSYWWLIFPLAGFGFAAWDRWLQYRRSRDALDLIKTYAAQGKEPPAELIRQVRAGLEDDDMDPTWVGRRARRYGRYGGYWEWRTAIVTGAVAVGFWLAGEYSYMGLEGPFHLVSIILACVSLGHVALGLLRLGFRRPR